MALTLYHRCQGCAVPLEGAGSHCVWCSQRRTDAREMLRRYPRIKFLSRRGVERVVGATLEWPLSESIRRLNPRQLVYPVAS